jgi:ADP-heptose:LPS heptosyltransferase
VSASTAESGATAGHVLVVRLDNVGDVVLSGPAVRAVAAGADKVTYLASSRGAAAAALLPGVDEVATFDAPWIDADPEPVHRPTMEALVEDLAGRRVDRALLLTSFHQSPLPLALLARMAGVPWIGAISVDYPGSLLDLRHQVDDDIHEVARALSLVGAAGYHLSPGDDGALAVAHAPTEPDHLVPGLGGGAGSYVVVHPGATVPARTWPPDRFAAAVDALAAAGHQVVVTGGRSEAELVHRVAGPPRPGVLPVAGGLSLDELAALLAGAASVVVGNTGPAHLAAAVGTPVVSLFAPTVPAVRWRPWAVPHVLLGDQGIACARCRARVCPYGDLQPCLEQVTAADVVDAVSRLTTAPVRPHRRVLGGPDGRPVLAMGEPR